MTTIRDRRGWLAKLRGMFGRRGPASTAEQMEQLRCELDALLDRDVSVRFRAAEGADISDAGRAALEQGQSPAHRQHIARMIGGGDG